MHDSVERMQEHLMQFGHRIEDLSSQVLLANEMLRHATEEIPPVDVAGKAASTAPKPSAGRAEQDDFQELESSASRPGARPSAKPRQATEVAAADPLFGDGLRALRNGKNARALQLFSDFVAQHPRDPRVASALYWRAESQYEAKQYQAAHGLFQQFLRQSPQHSRRPAALLKRGLSLQRVHKPAQAKRVLQRLLQEHAQSAEAELAKMHLRVLP